MASRDNLETRPAIQKGYPTLFLVLFIHLFRLSLFLSALLFHRRGKKGQTTTREGISKDYFPKWVSAFSLRGSWDRRKMMPFVTLGYQYQFPPFFPLGSSSHGDAVECLIGQYHVQNGGRKV